MREIPEVIEAGRVYLLDDFTYAQVSAVARGRVRFRLRDAASCLGRFQARRGVPPTSFRRRVLGEVDAAFFPEFADGGAPGFRHPPHAAVRLRTSLDDMAQRRPFGGREPDGL